MILGNRKAYPLVYTPKGEAIFPSLNEPDYKFNAAGEFNVRLRLDPDEPEVRAFQAQLEVLRDNAYETIKRQLTDEKKGALLKKLNAVPVLTDETDRESGEPTGKLILGAKLQYKVDITKGPKAGTSFTKKPDFFDAKGNRLVNPPKIGGGSILKLSIRPFDYFSSKDGDVGVSKELAAVQIITLRTFGARSASDYGFGEEEGDDLSDSGGFADESRGGGYSDDDNGDV